MDQQKTNGDEAVDCCLNSTALRATTISVAALVLLLMLFLWIWFLWRRWRNLPVNAVDDHLEHAVHLGARTWAFTDHREHSVQLGVRTSVFPDHREHAVHVGALRTSALTELPVFKYKKKNESITSDECSICLSLIQDGEIVSLLNCKHLYHQECIGLWLRSKASCPVCRSDARGGETELSNAKAAASPSMLNV